MTSLHATSFASLRRHAAMQHLLRSARRSSVALPCKRVGESQPEQRNGVQSPSRRSAAHRLVWCSHCDNLCSTGDIVARCQSLPQQHWVLRIAQWGTTPCCDAVVCRNMAHQKNQCNNGLYGICPQLVGGGWASNQPQWRLCLATSIDTASSTESFTSISGAKRTSICATTLLHHCHHQMGVVQNNNDN